MKTNTRKAKVNEALESAATVNESAAVASTDPAVEPANDPAVEPANEAATEAVTAEPTAEEKPKKEKKAPKKKEKAPKVMVKQLTNEELAELFKANGCLARSKAKSNSAVYNTFGTQSRVLQLKNSYQLLLTNGHQKIKEQVVECDNDDAARFMSWYGSLGEEKKHVIGADELYKTKLSASELPRERSVKIDDYDVLVSFIQYMATFSENKALVAE